MILRTSPSSHGFYGSKVKKRNKHQYVNECHLIFHHWSNRWFSLDVIAAMLVDRTIEKKSFGNLTLLLCKIRAIICYCFVHQHGRLITWLQTIYSENLTYHRRSIKRRSEVGKTSKFNQRSSQVKIKVRRPTKNRSSSQVLTFSAATNHKPSKVQVKKFCCKNVIICMDTHK